MITILKQLFIQTEEYGDAYQRPFSTQLTQDGQNKFAEAASQQRITAGLLAGMSHDLLLPSGAPVSKVNISGGWRERRMRFLIELRVEQSGLVQHYFVNGYSDPTSFTMSGHLDNDVKLYINSVNRVNTVTTRAGDGRQQFNNFGQAVQIISNFDTSPLTPVSMVPQDQHTTNPATQWDMLAGIRQQPVQQQPLIPIPSYTVGTDAGIHNWGNAGDTSQYTMNPSDVVARMGIDQITLSTNDQTFDLSNSVSASGGMRLTERKNNHAPVFLANTLNALLDVSNNPAMQKASAETILDEAQSLLVTPFISDNPFLDKLSHQTGYKRKGFTTYREMCSVFPGMDHVTIFWNRKDLISAAPENAPTRDLLGACSWAEATVEAQMGNMMSAAIPTIMINHLTTRCVIEATNHTVDGSVQVHVHSPLYFSTQPLGNMCPYIEAEFRKLIVPALSMNGQRFFQVYIYLNVMEETRMQISLNRGVPKPFISPLFSDSLTNNPMVTDRAEHLDTLALDMRILTNATPPQNY